MPLKDDFVRGWSLTWDDNAARARARKAFFAIVNDVMIPIKTNGMRVYSDDISLKRTISWYEAVLRKTIESVSTRDSSDDVKSALRNVLKRLQA